MYRLVFDCRLALTVQNKAAICAEATIYVSGEAGIYRCNAHMCATLTTKNRQVKVLHCQPGALAVTAWGKSMHHENAALLQFVIRLLTQLPVL